MRVDSNVYALDDKGVAIRGGVYTFTANAAAALSIQLPDGTFAPVTSAHSGALVSLAAKGALAPIHLPACTVKSSLAAGSHLVGNA
jgi:hypothetical protein